MATPPNYRNRPGWTEEGLARRKRRNNEVGAVVTTPAVLPNPAPPANTPLPVVAPKEDFKKIAQALLPFLSSEDQRGLADYYGITLPPRGIGPMMVNVPGAVKGSQPNLRNYYLNKNRATQALAALQNAQAASGVPGGAGYNFLNNAIRILSDYGGAGETEGMSRARYNQFSTAIDELFDLAKNNNDISQFVDLAGRFLRPTLSTGPLVNETVTNGQRVFGASNKRLFR